MKDKNSLILIIEVLVKKLGSHVKWLIGGSGCLFINGLDIIPNDIDVVIDTKDYNKAKNLLKEFVTGETIDSGVTLVTPFEVNNISGDLLAFDIHDKDLEFIAIGNVKVPVNKLEVELDFYKKRTDKKIENQMKISMIESALKKKRLGV